MSEAGLQVWNVDNSTFQIDGSTPHITLLRKGTVTTTRRTGSGPAVAYVEIPINPGEILGYRSPVPAGSWGVFDGKQYIVCSLPADQTRDIEYWIFSKHQASGIRYGMEVYGPTGELLYDSGRPMMNIVGQVDGTGTFPQSSSSIAVVPYQVAAQVDRGVIYVNVGPNPDYMLTISSTIGCIGISGSTVTVANQLSAFNATGPFPGSQSGPVNWVGTFNNGVDNRSLVIDTSNL
jgi:hypothetical protein